MKLFNSLQSMENIKPPGINGVKEEFYEQFWKEIKKEFDIFLDKRIIENKTHIILLNKNIKIISRAL